MTKATDLTNRKYDVVANKASKEEALAFKATMDSTHKVTIVQSGSVKKGTINFAVWCKPRKEAKKAATTIGLWIKSKNGTYHLHTHTDDKGNKYGECQSYNYDKPNFITGEAFKLEELPEKAKVCKNCLKKAASFAQATK